MHGEDVGEIDGVETLGIGGGIRDIASTGPMVVDAMGVEEDDGGGEVGVVVDEVGKVGICFSAFVSGRVESGGGIVDCVDGVLPAGWVRGE